MQGTVAMAKGYCALVLHAHLPFVRHPEYDSFLEERWFFEAMTETYIPLLNVLKRLSDEQVPCNLTVSLSPPLLAMMQDTMLQQRYRAHLEKLIELCGREQERTRHDGHLQYLAEMYERIFKETLEFYMGVCKKNPAELFKRLHQDGVIELITTTATHAVLPLLAHHPRLVGLQIHAGIDYFEETFGFRPKGIWLPECGYYPGLETMLRDAGIRYFITESHGITNASATPFFGVHTPLYTPAGVAAFARDQECTREVWSAREGFPGDPDYREFYRDIGHDLDFDYIKPYIAENVRVDTGIKYHRITGPTSHKELYHPDAAVEKAAHHAEIFMQRRIAHVNYIARDTVTTPIVVAPFDAELFGHWWFEGPKWLDYFIRKTVYDQNTIATITLSKYLDLHPVHQTGIPSASSWGENGYFEVWINRKNDWIYPQLDACACRIESLLDTVACRKNNALVRRAINQCLRELLLAQSSDWPFIMHTGSAINYAERRIKDHVARFHFLADGIENDSLNREHLQAIEFMDCIFPNIDYRDYI